jgi:hypothetical protein
MLAGEMETMPVWHWLGIVVGDWGVRCEIEVSGARVGNASVTREDIRGGIWNGFRC